MTAPDVSRETSERLITFEHALVRWSSRINLVASGDLSELRQRHTEDCLQLLPLLPTAGHIVDVGSGGGFPGLVIAIAGQRPVTLVEADARKATFLREAARLTGARVHVVNERVERCDIRGADIVTARACAPLPRLLGLVAPLLSPSAACFFLKGRAAATELTEAAEKWQMNLRRHPSRTRADACILEIRDLRPRPHAVLDRPDDPGHRQPEGRRR